ncbi:hypothetical protein ABID26_004031 [Mesorhizobium shonense]|uniref:Uncharacterized protein n=1 Tax=Mesorhizobium shonense TaxID=1209948 RepID=A0ABV2HVK5_9HYPH
MEGNLQCLHAAEDGAEPGLTCIVPAKARPSAN